MQPETKIHVGRSSGPTPNSMAAKNREIASAPGQPTAIPQMAGMSPYRSIKPVTRAGEAPIAMRMPISKVDCPPHNYARPCLDIPAGYGSQESEAAPSGP